MVESRLVVEGALSGHENMARDKRLLDLAEGGRAGCRVYRWDGPWVSLGRFQNPEQDLLDPDLVPWVARPTGGKAVLHGHDITVGLALPVSRYASRDGSNRSLRTAYRCAAAPLIEALRMCGVPAALGEQTSFLRDRGQSADCFASIAANDIVSEVDGEKVCGCALRFTRLALLLQASIPVEQPLVEPALLFAEPAPVRACCSIPVDKFASALDEALGLARP